MPSGIFRQKYDPVDTTTDAPEVEVVQGVTERRSYASKKHSDG